VNGAGLLQVLEMGQLLAQELYYEKEKARAEEAEREAQMEFHFDEDEKKKEKKHRPAISEDRSDVKIKTRKAEKPAIALAVCSVKANARSTLKSQAGCTRSLKHLNKHMKTASIMRFLFLPQRIS
jgi:hypothetical protein